jgi:hypothetical protein
MQFHNSFEEEEVIEENIEIEESSNAKTISSKIPSVDLDQQKNTQTNIW